MKFLLGIIGFFLFLTPLAAQQTILSGTITDEGGKPLQGASVQIVPFTDSTKKVTLAADKAGFFTIQDIPFNYYKVKVSYVGLQSVTLDSINVRKERSDFNLGEIVLKQKNSGQMSEIIVYAEKPLIQSKDGNITFNASESALSNGSNASDLLENVPLVTKDPDGKLLVKGKEPKILIDDKPVNLNLQQMQDLLESLPGSSIEKIEVMTNPPPQYANEQGGVINIVTKKGTVGMGARLTSALRGWAHLRFEVTEEPSAGVDGGRWSHTPELGIFHAVTDVHGNIMVSEDRIRYAYESGAGDPAAVYHELSLALGEAWDEELEPFRHAAEGAPVRWLHQVG